LQTLATAFFTHKLAIHD